MSDDTTYKGRFDGIPGLVWYSKARKVRGSDLKVGDWLDSLDHRGARMIYGVEMPQPNWGSEDPGQDPGTRYVTFSFGDGETVRTDVEYDVVDPDSQVDVAGDPV